MSNLLPSRLSTNAFRHRRYIAYFFLLLINLGLFTATAPLESPALIVILGFLVASLNIIILSREIVRFTSLMFPVFRRRQQRLTITISGFLIVMLALTSLGQLTWRDGIVVFIVWLLGYAYSVRFRLAVKSRP